MVKTRPKRNKGFPAQDSFIPLLNRLPKRGGGLVASEFLGFYVVINYARLV